MSKPFPTDDPFLRGYYAPLHMECDAPNLPVSGEMPKELNGWLYRNGPNPQFAPRRRGLARGHDKPRSGAAKKRHHYPQFPHMPALRNTR